ncbi:MAG TPA: hypothetical protein VGH72_33480 [Pseudonocardia sp.]
MTEENASYDIRLTIVDDVPSQGASCPRCAEEPVTSLLRLVTDTGTELNTDYYELCTGCVIPQIDSTAYLAEDETIELEVSRVATERPF